MAKESIPKIVLLHDSPLAHSCGVVEIPEASSTHYPTARHLSCNSAITSSQRSAHFIIITFAFTNAPKCLVHCIYRTISFI